MRSVQARYLSIREKYPEAIMALRIGVLANNAVLHQGEGEDKFVGDTTETALAEIAMCAGLNKHNLESVFMRLAEVPFDSVKKFMATLHGFDGESRIYVKGAPEVLLKKSGYYEKDGKIFKLTSGERKWFEAKAEEMAKQGLRVLAVGYKKADLKEKDLSERDVNDLIFVGLLAMSDPVRKDVENTLAIAKQAGIKVVMITGDHKKTAEAIGREIGLDSAPKNIFDGGDLRSISDDKLKQVIENISIFARVEPKDKIRIVEAFRQNGEVVAMTGDGVNDGPALKGADVGVALGSGTDVAKEISDLVLLDDNFSTIVAAVEEGRAIYQNIKKVLLYLLATSSIEVFLIAASLLAGMPLAILPAQILWINLIHDIFPALALSFDKGERENMQDPPRQKNEPILDSRMKIMILTVSVVTNIVLFSLFVYFLRLTNDLALTRTFVFVGLSIGCLFVVFSARSMRRMVWQINPFSNKYVTISVFSPAEDLEQKVLKKCLTLL